jgi:tRNA(Ile)-lysidine synthase TilS/MesJ
MLTKKEMKKNLMNQSKKRTDKKFLKMKLSDYQKVFEEYVSENNLLPKKACVYVLVSGGKDSAVMSQLIKELAMQRKDLEIKYLNVVFPQMVFGTDKKKIDGTVKSIGKGLKPFKSVIAGTDYSKLEVAPSACLLCKQVRRKIISDIIEQENRKDKKKNGKKNIIIATGHNNYDLLAYAIEFFSLNPKELVEKGINYRQLHNIKLRDEQLEHFSHFFPRLELESGVILIKPMLIFNRLEVEEMFCSITNQKKISFKAGCGIAGYLEACPYAKERPKRVLFNYLKTLPENEIKDLTNRGTYKEMLNALKQKTDNYNEALKKIKNTTYSELLM